MYLTQLNTLAILLLVPAVSQSFQLQIFICIQKKNYWYSTLQLLNLILWCASEKV